MVSINKAEKLDEIVMIVNEKNEPIRGAKREEMREKHLIHRSSTIFLINSKKQIYVNLRHKDKKWAPNQWDIGFGGVLGFDETYDENAQKELQEEAGVSAQLTELFDYFFQTEQNKCWTRCYLARHDGEIKEEEIQKYELMTFDEIMERSKLEEFAQDGYETFLKLKEKIEANEIKLD